jgi:hypothetical protein
MRSVLRQMPALTAAFVVALLAGCGSHARHTTGPALAHLTRGEKSPALGNATMPSRMPTQGSGGTGSEDDDDGPHAAASQVSSARSVARAFFSSYLAYLYGRLPPARVAAVDRGLRWQLERKHATTTPAERASRPRVARLSTTSSGPPVSVVAVAIVTAGPGPASRLTATLEPHRRRWLVVAVAW